MRELLPFIGLAALTAVGIEGWLLISGNRILLEERRVEPGEHYVAGDWGDLASNSQASLVCTYFTGRSAPKIAVYWYSASNVLGRDSCPFIWKPPHG
ncbi:hypothetical protein [Phenylobacterium sp.]|uniref:hypothetical protein n=1 Tax=Phenylobacterium sp. TaxID=1871053 RepID=UPI00393E07A2